MKTFFIFFFDQDIHKSSRNQLTSFKNTNVSLKYSCQKSGNLHPHEETACQPLNLLVQLMQTLLLLRNEMDNTRH